MFPRRSVDALDPKLPKIALFIFPVAVHVLQRLLHAITGGPDGVLSPPPEPLRQLEDFLRPHLFYSSPSPSLPTNVVQHTPRARRPHTRSHARTRPRVMRRMQRGSIFDGLKHAHAMLLQNTRHTTRVVVRRGMAFGRGKPRFYFMSTGTRGGNWHGKKKKTKKRVVVAVVVSWTRVG